MHVSHDRPCSIDLSDSAEIITVDRSHIGMINLKISAQTDKLFWRYSHHKYGLSVPFRMLHRKTAISKFADLSTVIISAESERSIEQGSA